MNAAKPGASSFALAFLFPFLNLRAADCNGNGIEDRRDVASGELLFSTRRANSLASSAESVTLADLDGDGDVDMAAASPDTGLVSILLNDGKAVFESEKAYEVAGRPVDIVSSDLDRDGDADLAATSQDPDAVEVLLNEGKGAFGPSRGEPLPASPFALTAADLDGDGDTDIAVAAFQSLVVLHNDGSGSLAVQADVMIGSNPVSVDAADLDGDGDLDLVTANSLSDIRQGSISRLLNDGSGGFSPAANFAAGVNLRSVVAGDLDGDRDADLAVAGDTLAILLNDGSGRFDEAAGPAIEKSMGALLAVDFDLDNDLDLIAAQPAPASVIPFLNDGAGRFSAGVSQPLGGMPVSLAAADLDGDADPDVVAAGGGLFVLLGDSRGAFERLQGSSTGSDPAVIISEDFDGDGDLDLGVADAVADEFASFSVLRNDGRGSFRAETSIRTVRHPYRMVAADVDNDLDIDVLLTGSDASASLLINDGDAQYTVALGLLVGGNVTALTQGDLDGDERVDVAAGSETGGVIVFFQGAAGDFPLRVEYPMVRKFPYYMIAVDLDGDRHLDLVSVTGDTHTLVVHWNDGKGKFNTSTSVPAGQYPLCVEAADLDADGDLDLAIANWTEGVSVFLNRGSRDLQRRGLFGTGPNPNKLLTRDLDGDGDVDIATAGDTLSVLLNAGDGTFGPPLELFKVMGHSVTLTAGDYDGSGSTDLALGVLSFSTGKGTFLFMNGTQPPFSRDRNRNGIPDECETTRFHRGDASGDGEMNITDALVLLGFLFLGEAAPGCREAADTNNDGALALDDAISFLQFLFLGGPAPAPPGPTTEPCGVDPDPHGTPGDLGCDAYPAC